MKENVVSNETPNNNHRSARSAETDVNHWNLKNVNKTTGHGSGATRRVLRATFVSPFVQKTTSKLLIGSQKNLCF
jgi:hypothetical protein